MQTEHLQYIFHNEDEANQNKVFVCFMSFLNKSYIYYRDFLDETIAANDASFVPCVSLSLCFRRRKKTIFCSM